MPLSPEAKLEFAQHFKEQQLQKCVDVLYRNLHEDTVRHFRKRVNSDQEAEELAQEGWRVVVEKLYQLKRPRSVHAWYWRVIKSVRIRHYRRNNRQQQLRDRFRDEYVQPQSALAHRTGTGPTRIDSPGARSQLERALATLGMEAQLIVRNRLKGKKYAEIAEFLGITSSKARKTYERSLKSIREQMTTEDAP